MLKLENGQATIVVGKASESVEAEMPSDAMRKLQNIYQNWYGAYFANTLTDEQLEDAHDWVVSADLKVLAYTAIRDEQIEWNNENVLKNCTTKPLVA